MSKDTNPIEEFKEEIRQNISTYGCDTEWQEMSSKWMIRASERRYTYNFSSLGRPIIQAPVDMVAMQEIIWNVRPDLIIETGIAHGGSLIQSASLLALLDYCDAVQEGRSLVPKESKRRVVGVDVDIRPHNRAAILAHPLSHRIDLIQGSSIADEVLSQIKNITKDYSQILVCLDSNHTHDHVLSELKAYAPLTSRGSYCVVFDTIVEDLPDSMFPNRPWGKGNNPKTAVRDYLLSLEQEAHYGADGLPLRFEIDNLLEDKLLLSDNPGGFLKRV